MCLYIIINILSNSCCGVLRAVVLGSCWTGSWGVPCRGAGAVSPLLGTSGVPVPAGVVAAEPRGTDLLLSLRPFMVTPPRGQGHRLVLSITIVRKTQFLHLRRSWKRQSRLHHLHVHSLKPPLPSGPHPPHLSSGGSSAAGGGDAPRLLLAVPSAAASSLLLARAARSCSRSSWIFPSSARSSRAPRGPSGGAASSWKRTRRTSLRRLRQGCRGAQLLGRGRRAEWGAGGKQGRPFHGPPEWQVPRGGGTRGGACTSALSWAAGSAAPLHLCSEHGGFSVWDKRRVRWGD